MLQVLQELTALGALYKPHPQGQAALAIVEGIINNANKLKVVKSFFISDSPLIMKMYLNILELNISKHYQLQKY